jgi:hypothetical protein
MALPAGVAAQVVIINVNLNKIVADRERINDWFDDGLGASVWSLLTVQNQTAAKNALTADMQAAVNAIQSAINALAAM